MSEPTSGGTHDPKPDPDKDQGETQDGVSEPVFNDPTAPVWADPTAPIPTSPTPPVAPPLNNPYAPPPPAQPYGEQPAQPGQYGQYGQQPGQYGQQQPGQQYPAYGQQPYATGPQTESNGSAIVLTILSGVLMLSTCFLVGIPSLVFGIMGLTSNTTDPVGSRKKAKTGWIILAVNFGIVVLLAIVGFGLLIATGNNLDNNFSY